MRRSFAGLLTVGVLATSASAADLDYTYLEAGFGKVDADESAAVETTPATADTNHDEASGEMSTDTAEHDDEEDDEEEDDD